MGLRMRHQLRGESEAVDRLGVVPAALQEGHEEGVRAVKGEGRG